MPGVDRCQQAPEFCCFPFAEKVSHVVCERSHLRRCMPGMPSKVDFAIRRGEKPAPVPCGKPQGDPTHHGSERKGRRPNAPAVLRSPAFPHRYDEAAYPFEILRQTKCIAIAFIQGPCNRCDEDSMALQPGVHVPHRIYGEASISEKPNNVLCSLLHDGVLLRNIEISDDGNS